MSKDYFNATGLSVFSMLFFLQGHAHRAVRIDKGFGVIHKSLDLIGLGLGNVALLFEHKANCRSTQIELFLFGFQPALGKFTRRLRGFDSGLVPCQLALWRFSNFQRNLLRLRCHGDFLRSAFPSWLERCRRAPLCCGAESKQKCRPNIRCSCSRTAVRMHLPIRRWSRK